MFLLLLLSGLIRGIGYIVSKYISLGKESAHAMALANSITDTFICLPILIYFIIKPSGVEIGISLVILSVISAAAYGISISTQYSALKKIDMSVMGIVLRLGIVFSSLIGVVILGEQMDAWNYAGLAVILLGNFIILSDGRKFNLNLGILFTIMAALFGAISSTMDKYILTKINSVLYVFINSFLIALTLFLMRPKSLPKSLSLIKTRSPIFLLMSGLTIAAWLIGSYVLQNMDVSKYIPVQKTITLIIPVLFGILIFHEKNNLKRKLIGLLLAVLGIALMYI